MTDFAAALEPMDGDAALPASSRTLVEVPAGVLSAGDFGKGRHQARPRRRRVLLSVGAAALFGLLIYAVIHPSPSSPTTARLAGEDPSVAVEGFFRIKPGMALGEVTDFLDEGKGGSLRGSEDRNPLVTLENYRKIKPGLALGEVEDILGPARNTYEEGMVLGSAGHNRKWRRHNWGGRVGEHSQGTDAKFDDETYREVRLVVAWPSGNKAITVTFTSRKVTGKSEQGLIAK